MEFSSIGSLSEFNKIFRQNVNQVNSSLNGADEFAAAFNNAMQPQQKLNAGIDMTVGMDAIAAQKIENLSPTAKMAKDFSSSISNGIESLNATQKEAEQAVETLASGGDISIHDVMIASQKSNLSMQLALQLRNQMINAYNEFKNIRI